MLPMYEKILEAAAEFIEKYNDPSAWIGSVTEYNERSDSFTHTLIYIAQHDADDSTKEKINYLI